MSEPELSTEIPGAREECLGKSKKNQAWFDLLNTVEAESDIMLETICAI